MPHPSSRTREVGVRRWCVQSGLLLLRLLLLMWGEASQAAKRGVIFQTTLRGC